MAGAAVRETSPAGKALARSPAGKKERARWPFSIHNNTVMRLTAKHEYLIQMLSDPEDMRTQAEKGKAAGVTPRTVYVYLKDKGFLAALHAKTTELVAAKRAGIYRNLYRDSGKGDTPAAVAYLKGAGDIQGGVNVQTSITQNNSKEQLDDSFDEAQAERETRILRARAIASKDQD